MAVIKIFETDTNLFRLGIEYASYLDEAIQKSNEVLSKLSKKYGVYIREVNSINYKNKVYRLINTFPMVQNVKCKICGNRPIKEMFILSSNDGNTLRIGPTCIDRLTNMEVSKWIIEYRKKRENVIKNSKKIDGLSLLIDACMKWNNPCRIRFGEVEKLRAILKQMSKGLDLNWKQETFIERYLNKEERLCDYWLRILNLE
jgi:hypothetical protein